MSDLNLVVESFSSSTVGTPIDKQLLIYLADDNCKNFTVFNFKNIASYEVRWMGPSHDTRRSGTCFSNVNQSST